MEHLIRLFKLDKRNKELLMVKLVAYLTLVTSLVLLVATAFATLIDSNNINQGVSITLSVLGAFIFVSALILFGIFIHKKIETSKRK